MKIHLIIFNFLFFGPFIKLPVYAAEFAPYWTSVRVMGMGGVSLGIVDDKNSVWYNPAALASPGRPTIDLFDLNLGTGLNVISKFQDIQTALKAGSLSGKAAPFFGLPVSMHFSGMMGVFIKHIALGFFYNSNNKFIMRNPIYPEMIINSYIDYGFLASSGFKMYDFLELGMTLKYIRREGFDFNGGTASIFKLIPDFSAGFSGVNINSFAIKGHAFGMNLGARLIVPTKYKNLQWIVATTYEDLFGTKFRALSDAQVAGVPAGLDATWSAGASIKYTMSKRFFMAAGFDYRGINLPEINMYKKIFMGAELGLGICVLRGGLYQGYPSYGFTFYSLPIFDISFASYGAELGEFPGQKEDRRYLVQFSTALNF